MHETLCILMLVAGALPLTLLVHLLLCRWYCKRGQRPTQGSALAAAVFTTAVTTGVSGLLSWGRVPFWPPVLYSTLLSGAAAYVYFVMFCNTESGRRYHVLEILADSPGINPEEVHAAYSTTHVLGKRLERMCRWGILEERAGRVRIRKRSSVWVARMFAWWGRLLTFPVWNYCPGRDMNMMDCHGDAGESERGDQPQGTAPGSGSRGAGLRLACAYLVVLAVTAGYCYKTGLIVVLADSYALVDRSKHLALHGNLNLSEGTNLGYPPLYSVLLSPAYLLSKPREIELALRLINILIYSLAIFPIWGLLKTYAKLDGRELWWGSVFLALLPCTLPWASILLTEVLYLPLLYWFCYALTRFVEQPSRGGAVLLGMILGLCHLTREAAGVVVVAFLAIGLLDTGRRMLRSQSWGGLAACYAGALGMYGLLVIGWRFFEAACVVMPTNQGYGVLVLPAMKRTLTNWVDFILHVRWFMNCQLYYLTASLTLAGLFVAVLCAIRPRLLFEDLFLSFSVLCLIGSALCIFLFFDSSLGDRKLAWNKYLIPYVLPIPVIALRYRGSAGWGMLTCCIALLGGLCLAAAPCRITCFMPDSLTFFTMPRYSCDLSQRWRAVGYFAAVVVPFLLLRLPWRWGKALGLITLFTVSGVASLAASAYWRESHLNQRHYAGLGKQIYQLLRENPGLALYHEVPYNWTGIDLKAKFYLPQTDVPIRRLEEILTTTPPADQEVLYLTTRTISDQRPNASDWCRWKLYRFSLASLHRQHQRNGLGGAEVLDGHYEFTQLVGADGKPVFVTEMKPSFRVKAFTSHPGAQARIRMRVATRQQIPKDVQLWINGQPIGESVRVGPEYTWPNIFIAEWQLRLVTEESILEFKVSPPQPLSVNRPAGVLLVEEPEVELLPDPT
jgi:hypothetical protein